MLDAFMDSKRIIKPEEWRGFCSDKVPLFVADKLCFTNEEGIYGKVQVANYSGRSLRGDTLYWRLERCEKVYSSGYILWKAVKLGHWVIDSSDEGLIDVSSLRVPIGVSDRAGHYRLQLRLSYNAPANIYELWSYPEESNLASLKRGIIIAHQMTDEIGEKLMEGASVLLMPDSTEFVGNTVGPLFQTDYWNYGMFKTICEDNKKAVSPGTLGILCQPQHPLFRSFPTQEHTNWQWFRMATQRAFLLPQSFPAIITEMDSYAYLRPMAQLLEARCLRGRLLLSSLNLQNLQRWPECRALQSAIYGYLASDAFQPGQEMPVETLQWLFTPQN
jgi:hypothetical protein